jgi:hypothetical protein
MRLCGHIPLLRIETSDPGQWGQHWFLPPLGQSGEAMFVIGLHLFGTSGKLDLPGPILNRLLCHGLVQRLPEDALPEAVESLSEMYKFYRQPFLQQPVLPAPTSIPVRMGPAIVRPVFPVTEEE